MSTESLTRGNCRSDFSSWRRQAPNPKGVLGCNPEKPEIPPRNLTLSLHVGLTSDFSVDKELKTGHVWKRLITWLHSCCLRKYPFVGFFWLFFLLCNNSTTLGKRRCKPHTGELIRRSFVCTLNSVDGTTGVLPVVTGAFAVGQKGVIKESPPVFGVSRRRTVPIR